MPSNGQTQSVEELLEKRILYIGDGYRAKNREFGPVGTPFLRVGNVGDNGEIDFSNADLFPDTDLHKVGVKISRPGDIAFTSKGTVGRFIYVKPDTRTFVYSPQISFWRVLNEDMLCSRFLLYWMQGREFTEQIYGLKSQTDMADYVSLSDQRRMKITLPPLPIQQRIAEILGRLDDKIEVNRRINRTLEAMAQALYQHWFVDFGPFQAGEFVESELGPIPVGWRVGQLGDLARVEKNTVDPQDLSLETPYIGLADMPKGSIALDTWGQAEDSTSTKFRMQAGQILFGKLRPYFKKIGVSPVDGVCSTDIYVVVPKQPEYYGFVLTQLIQQEFIDYTEAVSDGTRMPRVNWAMMAKYPVAIPDQAVLVKFNHILKPWTEIIVKNTSENRQLDSIRDYLLPKLLSGEVPVLVGDSE
jgi:type I restriction enzyme S subunit